MCANCYLCVVVYCIFVSVLQLRSSVRLFLYQKLLVKSAENMSVTFGMNYQDLLPLVYFMRDRGICQLNLNEFKTVRPLIYLIQAVGRAAI